MKNMIKAAAALLAAAAVAAGICAVVLKKVKKTGKVCRCGAETKAAPESDKKAVPESDKKSEEPLDEEEKEAHVDDFFARDEDEIPAETAGAAAAEDTPVVETEKEEEALDEPDEAEEE